MNLQIEQLISLNIILLDQLTKMSAKSIVYKPMTSFFNIAFVRNYGTTFGFFQFAHGGIHALIFIMILVIFSFAIYLFSHSKYRHEKIAYAMIIGGATGNIIDRLRDGYVTDFIQLHLGPWYYPTFNIADSFIVMGITVLMFFQLFQKNINKILTS